MLPLSLHWIIQQLGSTYYVPKTLSAAGDSEVNRQQLMGADILVGE